MVSADDGGDGAAAAGVPGGTRGSGSAPGDAPELSGCTGASLRAGGRKMAFWVPLVLPEVGGVICGSPSWVEGSGRLLEVQWW